MGVEPRLFAPHGGSFPIRVRDVGVVGSVTVSGLPEADDHAFVVEMIEAFLAASIASRRRGFIDGSGPLFAATMISLVSLVKSRPLAAALCSRPFCFH